MLDFLRTMENTRQFLCTIAVFDLPVSDHGKAAAQEHWMRMQQIFFSFYLFQIMLWDS